MAKKIKPTYGATARKEMRQMEREAKKPKPARKPIKKGY